MHARDKTNDTKVWSMGLFSSANYNLRSKFLALTMHSKWKRLRNAVHINSQGGYLWIFLKNISLHPWGEVNEEGWDTGGEAGGVRVDGEAEES